MQPAASNPLRYPRKFCKSWDRLQESASSDGQTGRDLCCVRCGLPYSEHLAGAALGTVAHLDRLVLLRGVLEAGPLPRLRDAEGAAAGHGPAQQFSDIPTFAESVNTGVLIRPLLGHHGICGDMHQPGQDMPGLRSCAFSIRLVQTNHCFLSTGLVAEMGLSHRSPPSAETRTRRPHNQSSVGCAETLMATTLRATTTSQPSRTATWSCAPASERAPRHRRHQHP